MSVFRSIITAFRRKNLGVVESYKLWAATYDNQPGNIVLQIEEEVFTRLLQRISVDDKRVVDIGCGTGRHWGVLMSRKPASLIGIDVSQEMLNQLKKKFPEANVVCSADSTLPMFEDNSVDVVVSTLTIGHIADVETAMHAWCRILRPGGALLVTDFHPEGFRKGMTRTFTHDHKTVEVENHYHSLNDVQAILATLQCTMESVEERPITSDFRAAFERAGNLDDYERYLGTPLIFGFIARKSE